MRKVALALAIGLAFAGSAVVTTDAQTTRGANNIATEAQNFTPLQPAACRGWGHIAGRDWCAWLSLLVSSLLVRRDLQAARPPQRGLAVCLSDGNDPT